MVFRIMVQLILKPPAPRKFAISATVESYPKGPKDTIIRYSALG